MSRAENEIVENFLRENTFRYNDDRDENSTRVSTSAELKSGPRSSDTANIYHDDESALIEDIRKMARALAPQMSELDDVLRGFNSNKSLSTLEDEDDDLDDEITQLATAEQSLRDELEFASEMSLLGSPIRRMNNDHTNSNKVDLPSPVILNASFENNKYNNNNSNNPQNQMKINHKPVDVSKDSAYTLQDHADYLQLRTERTGRWYYSDMTAKLLPVVLGSATTVDIVKDYCLPIPFRKLKRLYSGLVFHDVWQNQKRAQGTSKKSPPRSPIGTPLVNRSLQMTPGTSSQSTSKLRGTPGFTMPVPATPATPGTSEPDTTDTQAHPPLSISKINCNSNSYIEEPLPVRTICIRVRPDVLCGAIMDAANHAFETLPSSCTTHIIKRQGGHLRGVVFEHHKQLAYVADIQLCTQKNDELERRLLLRFYHIQDDPESLEIIQQEVPPSPYVDNLSNTNLTEVSGDNDIINQQMMTVNRHLRQTCSLIQRLMAAEQQEGGIQNMDRKQQSSWLGLKNSLFTSKEVMQDAIGCHLESNYKSCPSVREENKKATPTIRRLTLPSLSKRDWSMLDVSWTLMNHIVDELDTRDCSYNTLSTLSFGQFPCLPTLDVQYCSQLRRLSRENMITHLLRSAKGLEEYARLAEYNCAVCVTMLDPMITHYDVPALLLPAPKSLDEYPLEYTPPQLSCPPWGGLVMEALNKVSAKTPTRDISLAEALRMVYQAFMKQDDEEQSARLGRKNAQIMERLANMQSHQRAIIQNIRDSHVHSQTASEASALFLKGSQQASNKGGNGHPSILHKDVPLLDIKISLGASQSGRCYVTVRHVLFVTSYIPLLGSISSTLFDINLISVQVVTNPTTSLLNPFPNTVDITLKSTDELLYSFRPAMGPTRLQTFINIIRVYANESKPSEYSQVVENDDRVMRITESKTEDDHELAI